MTEPRDIIARGRELTGRKLLAAIEAARTQVVGGRGIMVNQVGSKAVVNVKGHPIIPKGAGSDIIIGHILEVQGILNATYTVGSRELDAAGDPVIELSFVTPSNRFFEENAAGFSLVDYLAAPVSDGDDEGKGMVKIIKYGHAGDPPPIGEGACVRDAGVCTVGTKSACAALSGTYVPDTNCPGYIVEIVENVKIATCPPPVPAPVLPPPPTIAQVLGALN